MLIGQAASGDPRAGKEEILPAERDASRQRLARAGIRRRHSRLQTDQALIVKAQATRGRKVLLRPTKYKLDHQHQRSPSTHHAACKGTFKKMRRRPRPDFVEVSSFLYIYIYIYF